MAKKKAEVAHASVHAIKGFNADLTCRGYKFEVGKTYSVDGPIKACNNGFHACPEHPLDVFEFYPPAQSIYHEVEQRGELDESHRPQKLASASITIGVQISVHDLIARAVKFVFDRAKPSNGSTSDEENGAASSTGYQGAASSTGYKGAASSTGYQGAASSTGKYGAASSTGKYGAASSTGYKGAASSTGAQSVAMATGYEGKARAGETGAICLVCRDDKGNIFAIRASKVGENGVKPNVFYRLNAAGKFIEAE